MKNLNKRTLILLGILLAVVIYYVLDAGVFSGNPGVKRAPANQKQAGGSEQEELDPVQKYTRVAALVELDWGRDWEADPFYYVSRDTLAGAGGLMGQLFGVGTAERSAGFKLTGISWHGTSGYAIINGSIVKEGNTIGGYQICKVAFDYVVLRQGTERIRLSISE